MNARGPLVADLPQLVRQDVPEMPQIGRRKVDLQRHIIPHAD
jgi:hypothetical protein